MRHTTKALFLGVLQRSSDNELKRSIAEPNIQMK
jgi:hypothetical protein